MPESFDSKPDNTVDQRVAAALADYMQRIDAGLEVDCEAFIDEYPDIADQLRAYFRQTEEIRGNLEESTEASQDSKPASRRIGPYKLLQQIGEGGMGTVWMADQLEPVRRRVALKVIKAGTDSKQVIARFEAERQALAMMDHQNIAKVLDAGTAEDGSPYFVMELVQGIPITEYCDRNKLTPRERLELFVPVCKAVQHAHQKGIIHRDLKPSNVLVQLHDGKPVAKVIDFGLAKALQHQSMLTDKTLFTEFGQVVGTLQYMSPEQATMDALVVDTRTDIYSLGVMLYELLAGSTPIERETLKQNALLQILQMIREKDPPRPSHRLSSSGEKLQTISEHRQIQPTSLQQILRGDLDWIVMRALEKDRTRRYETADSFSDDIERYLAGDAIAARPPSTSYRISKFVNKNRGLVATAITVTLLVCMIAVISPIVAIRQRQLRQDATVAKNRAQHEALIAKQATKAAIESNNKLQRRLYNSNMQIGFRAWETGDVGTARKQLERFTPVAEDPENGGLEWRVLRGLCRPHPIKFKLTELSPNTGHIKSAALFRDGRRVAIGTDQGYLLIWDLREGIELQRIAAHDNAIHPVWVSPDNKTTVSVTQNKVRRWDIRSGALINEVSVDLSDLTAAGEFSRNASRLITGHEDGSVREHNLESSGFRELLRVDEPIAAVALAGDDETVAVAINDGGGAKVYIWQNGLDESDPTELPCRIPIFTLAFSPSGDKLAYAGDGRHGLVDLENQKVLIPTSNQHYRPIYKIGFAADGASYVTAGSDRRMKLWHTPNKRRPSIAFHCDLRGNDGGVGWLQFDGRYNQLVSAGGRDSLLLWNLSDWETWNCIGAHSGRLNAVLYHPSETSILTAGADNSICIWDRASLARQALYQERHDSREPTCMAFLSAGKEVVTGWSDGLVRVFDANSLTLRRDLTKLNGKVEAIAISPGDDVVAVAVEGLVQILNASTGDLIREIDGYYGPGGCLHFSPNGETLYVGNGMAMKRIRWQQTAEASLKLLGTISRTFTSALSSDGSMVAGGCWSGEIHIWDAAADSLDDGDAIIDQKPSRTLSGHIHPVTTLAFSPTNDVLVSCDRRDIRFWDPVSGECTGEIDARHGDLTAVALASDGRSVATGNSWGGVILWGDDHISTLTSALADDGEVLKKRNVDIQDAISPTLTELRRQVGNERSVTYTVRSATQNSQHVFLLSSQSFLNWNSVYAAITTTEWDKLRDLGIHHRSQMVGRQIRVRSQVGRRGSQISLLVNNIAEQFEIFDSAGKPYSLRENLGELYSLREEFVDDMLRSFGPIHPDTVDAFESLAAAYERSEMKEQAGRLWERFSQAITAYLDEEPENPETRYQAAVAALAIRDFQTYKLICRDMLERHRKTEETKVAERIGYACVVAPEATADPSQVVNLAQMTEQLWPGAPRLTGAALFRAGDFAAALQKFEEAQANGFEYLAWDHAFLAMILHRLERHEEAAAALAAAKEHSNEYNSWHEKTEQKLLIIEAQALLATED